MKLLVAISDDMLRSTLAMLLTARGYSCSEAANTNDALKVLKSKAIEIVIVARALPPQGCISLIEENRELSPRRPVLVVSGGTDETEVKEIEKLGAHYFQFGFQSLDLPALVRKLYFLAYETPTMCTVWQIIGNGAEAVNVASGESATVANERFKLLTDTLFRAIAHERNISMDAVPGQTLSSLLGERSKVALSELLYWAESQMRS